MSGASDKELVNMLRNVLTTDEEDEGGHLKGVTDGLFAIARGLNRIADAIETEGVAHAIRVGCETLAVSLDAFNDVEKN